MLVIVNQDAAFARKEFNPNNGILVVVWKYNGVATLSTADATGYYTTTAEGKLWRAFPAGSKNTLIGDGRLPEGIYQLTVERNEEHAISLTFVFETLPNIYERYTLAGRTLDRNAFPFDPEFLAEIHSAVDAVADDDKTQITLIVLPGIIPESMRDDLKRARNVKDYCSLDALDHSVRRWAPLDSWISATGRVPEHTSFDRNGVFVIEDVVPKSSAPTVSMR